MTLELLIEFMHSSTMYQIFSFNQYQSGSLGPWYFDYDVIDSGLMDRQVECVRVYGKDRLQVCLYGDDIKH